MNKKVILGAFAAVAVIITAVSFFKVKAAQDPSRIPARYDSSELMFARAKQFLDEGSPDRAVTAFVAVATQFPGTDHAQSSLRSAAELYHRKGEQAKANYYYGRLVKEFPNVPDKDKIKSEMERINIEKLMSPKQTEDSVEHIVGKGDTLYGIARKYNTTVAMLKKNNNLKSDVITRGQKLKVNAGNFSIFVDKSRNVLVLSKDGVPFKTYTVSTGQNNSTPVGTFKIVDKLVSPPWTNPEGKVIMPDNKEYQLGKRWMALSVDGIGIHGTHDESTIGGQVTAGCVRMHNDDVVELYDIVTMGTEVTIVDGDGAVNKSVSKRPKQ